MIISWFELWPLLQLRTKLRPHQVVSGFGPYHCLVHADAPAQRAGVIPTPWAMPLMLGFGTILLGDE